MRYLVYFSDGGTPKTGLTPTVDVYAKVSDGTSAGTAPTVAELSGGFYAFDASPSVAVACRVNSGDGTMSDGDRYKVLQITPDDANLDAAVSTRSTFDNAVDEVTTDSASRDASKADVSAVATSVEVGALPNVGEIVAGLLAANPTGDVSLSLGECLEMILAMAAGRFKIIGSTFNIYKENGTTVLKSFTLSETERLPL